MAPTVSEARAISAIIPTLGRDLDRLSQSVDAVRNQTYSGAVEVFVVLNTPESVELPDHLDDVRVLRPRMNLGWAGGLAYARSVATSSRLWLVQDDMVAEPGCLEELTAALDAKPRLGAVSPIVLNDDGLVPPDSCGGWIDPGPPATERFFPSVATAPAELAGFETLDYVSSRGTLVRVDAWDTVGGMYPGFYPVQWADISFHPRLARAGFESTLVPTAHVRHASHSSTPSAYGHFLFARHRNEFWRRFDGEGFDPPQPDPAIPHDLLQIIALGATGVCTDLSAAYVAAREEIVATHEAAAQHAAAMLDEVKKAQADAAAVRAELERVREQGR